MKFIKKHQILLTAIGLFILAIFLRTFRLPEFIAYHQDQVRDLLYVKDYLRNGNFIYLGPKASVGNFYLAPLWYYLMAITYMISRSPIAPALMVAILNSSAVVVLYFFMKRFFDVKSAVIASLLYAVSPFSIEYSRFAWNPNPIPLFAIIAIYCLCIYIYTERKNFFYLAVIAANFSFQLHYQGFLLVAAVFLFPLLRKDWKRLLLSALLFIGLLAPFLIYELNNGYPNLSQIVSFLGRTTTGRSLGFINSLRAFTIDYPEFVARVLFFGNKILGLVFSLVTYALILKNMITKKAVNKWGAFKVIHLVFAILLLTLFAYRQWIVPYYLLVAVIPLIIVATVNLGRFKILLLALVAVNLALSPAFAKTDSSFIFFQNSLSEIKKSTLSKNCIEYKINDPDLKFARSAVDYLSDLESYEYPIDQPCKKRLVFCETNLCDKIKGISKLESQFLGLSLIEK